MDALSDQPAVPPPPRRSAKRRRGTIEWVAPPVSWALAAAWWIVAYQASVGVYEYFGYEEPCGDPPHPGDGSFEMWLLALLTLVGGAIWSSIASRPLPSRRAARRAIWMACLFLVLSLMPIMPFGPVGFPYVFGLNIRAGRTRFAPIRWAASAAALFAALVSMSYWFDGLGCI